MRYILFNKPYGVISQFTTDLNHKTLAQFNLPKEVYPVGRLDKDSEGLLLLSNDGEFINAFLKKHQRVYYAQVERVPTQERIEYLQRGVELKTGKTKPCKIKLIDNPVLDERDPPIRFRKTVPTAWLEILLREGKNRQVRRMTAHIGHPTLRLFRVALGKLHLFNNIKIDSGEWIEIEKSQII